MKSRMNKRMRVVQEAGVTNVTYKNISKKRRKYISDLYTTLLDVSWGQCVLLFSASLFTSWLMFASFYYVLSFLQGDLTEDHLPDTQEKSQWIPCILGIDGFISALLFSLETQHTVGYGTRAITTSCLDISAFCLCSGTDHEQKHFYIFHLFSVCLVSFSNPPTWSYFLQAVSAKNEDKDCDVQSMCCHQPEEQNALSYL
jgi:hypothetical protein